MEEKLEDDEAKELKRKEKAESNQADYIEQKSLQKAKKDIPSIVSADEPMEIQDSIAFTSSESPSSSSSSSDDESAFASQKPKDKKVKQLKKKRARRETEKLMDEEIL